MWNHQSGGNRLNSWLFVHERLHEGGILELKSYRFSKWFVGVARHETHIHVRHTRKTDKQHQKAAKTQA